MTDAGIQISGTNAEVMPAQWEYQVGPCTGISSKLRKSSQKSVFQELLLLKIDSEDTPNPALQPLTANSLSG
jgi:hypothetical protein